MPHTPEHQDDFTNWGFPPSSTPSATINTLQDVLLLAQDPAFQLQSGLITPETLLQFIQQSINETVLRPIDFDYQAIRASTPEGDITLNGAYDLIDSGMTVNQVRAKMLEDIAKSKGDGLSAAEVSAIDARMEDVIEYARRRDNFMQKNEKTATGEWTENPVTGEITALSEDARSILSGIGLEGFAGIPQMWNLIENPALREQSQRELASAEEARNKWIQEGKKAAKTSQSAAEAAYKQFIATQTSGGKKPTYEATVKYVRPGKRYNDPYTGVPSYRGGVKIEYTNKTAAANDMWAKMAASYAGRAAQENANKPAAAERKKAEDLFNRHLASAEQARAQGIIPALELLMNAPRMASYAAQPAPAPSGGGRPAPRVLSDEEIESMATMIAGGFA